MGCVRSCQDRTAGSIPDSRSNLETDGHVRCQEGIEEKPDGESCQGAVIPAADREVGQDILPQREIRY